MAKIAISIPDELLEAARIDGAGPLKFFIDILVPLSRTTETVLGVSVRHAQIRWV